MSEPQQQYGKRWDELPPDEQQSGYWLAIPDDPDNILDDLEYEVVYVAPDYHLAVFRPGSSADWCLSQFRFLYRLDLPETAETAAEAEERARLYGRVMSEPNRQLEAAVDRMRQADSCGPDWSCLLYHDDVDRRMVDDVAMIVRAYLRLPPELSGNSGQLTPPGDPSNE